MGVGRPVIVMSCHRVHSRGFQCTLDNTAPHAFHLATRGLEEVPNVSSVSLFPCYRAVYRASFLPG